MSLRLMKVRATSTAHLGGTTSETSRGTAWFVGRSNREDCPLCGYVGQNSSWVELNQGDAEGDTGQWETMWETLGQIPLCASV